MPDGPLVASDRITVHRLFTRRRRSDIVGSIPEHDRIDNVLAGLAVRRGRPRDPRVGAAALDAAVELLGEVGYSGLTVDEVALRAGVGKASVYLRWPDKDALVADALGHGSTLLSEPPDTGTLAEDMRGFLRSLVRLHEAGFARAASAVSGEVLTNAALREAFRHSLIATVTARVATVVNRAIQRGELPPSTDVEMLAIVPMALLQQARLSADPRPDPKAVVERIVDQFFTPTNPTPAPSKGRPRAQR